MRHLLVLGIATLLLATLTWQAWQYDHNRQQARASRLETQLNHEALVLEQQYLAYAHTLISLLAPEDTLLAEIEQARESLEDLPLAQRQRPFQALVERIRVRLLQQAPDPARSDVLLQEWRRLTDQMNGALHRHRQLLEQGSVAPQ